MTKETVLAGLQKCAKKLGRTPTYTEIWRMSKITKYMIKLHFGSLAEALKRAGIAARGIGHRLDTLTLLEDWAHLTRKVGRPPSFMEYRRAGNYGANSFLNRCGAWGPRTSPTSKTNLHCGDAEKHPPSALARCLKCRIFNREQNINEILLRRLSGDR